MQVKIKNFNNNDTEHDIVFLSFTEYATYLPEIIVLFDGIRYKAIIYTDSKGHKYFKHCGKTYDVEIKR